MKNKLRMKICPVCGKELPKNAYSFQKYHKKCCSIVNRIGTKDFYRKKRATNKEYVLKQKKYAKKWLKKNKERFNEYKKKWQARRRKNKVYYRAEQLIILASKRVKKLEKYYKELDKLL